MCPVIYQFLSLTCGMEGKGTFLQDASCHSLKNSALEGQTAILEQEIVKSPK